MFTTKSRRRLRVGIAAVLVLGAAVLTPQASVAEETVPRCTGQAHWPHYSHGPGGVIAKSTYVCKPGVTQLYYAGYLYYCGDSRPSTPSSAGCSMVASGGDAKAPPKPGEEYTQYIPPTGALFMNGWYITATNWAWQVGTATFTGFAYSGARYCTPLFTTFCIS